MRVLAVDPGQTTGLFEMTGAVDVFAGQVDDQFELCRWMWTRLNMAHDRSDNLRVVMESFVINQRTVRSSQGTWSLEIIGATKWMCRYLNVPFYMQRPADAMGFVSDRRLRTMGLWKPGLPHAMDAARHAVLHLSKHGQIEVPVES